MPPDDSHTPPTHGDTPSTQVNYRKEGETPSGMEPTSQPSRTRANGPESARTGRNKPQQKGEADA